MEQAFSIPKKVKMWEDEDGLEAAAGNIPDELLAEVVHNHVFFYLINIARPPGKNEHMIYEQRRPGEPPLPTLLAIDLDRINTSGRLKASGFAVCKMCKVGEHTLHQLERIVSMTPASFNNMLQDTLRYDEFPISIGKAGETLFWRAEQMLSCFRDCIEARGRHEVVIPDDAWR